MNRFWEATILPVLRSARPRVLVEIGSLRGAMTAELLSYCAEVDGVTHAIDPAPSFDPSALKAKYGERLVFHHCRSLEALPLLPVPEAVFIDGDHNWYTVYNELKALETKVRQANASFPLTFFHDVHWPYGRRDLYYDPGTIPAEYRHEFAHRGVVPGRREPVEHGGLNRGAGNACHEGGPRNGVLTAIEDFQLEAGEPLELVQVVGLHGLALLVSVDQLEKNAELAERVARLTAPDFLVEQSRVIEAERIRVLIELQEVRGDLARARKARSKAAADRQRMARDARKARQALVAAEDAVARLRSRRSWRWRRRLIRAFPSLGGRKAPGEAHLDATANGIRQASELLDRSIRPGQGGRS